MTTAIYVPQGRSIRLTHETAEHFGINGVYTDSFSTCNIIVVASATKVAVIHADMHMSIEDICREIDWVEKAEKPRQIKFIFRDGYFNDFTKERVNKLFGKKGGRFSDEHIVSKKVTLEQDGVLASFLDGETENIRIFDRNHRPERLVRHPQEQRFLAIQKIEQLIGRRACVGSEPHKTVCIFDGNIWVPIPAAELRIDDSQKITAEEIHHFARRDSYVVLAGKLLGFMGFLRTQGIGIGASAEMSADEKEKANKEFVDDIAMHLEGYLGDYGAFELLKRNLLQLLDESDPNSVFCLRFDNSPADKRVCRNLLGELRRGSADAVRIEQVMSAYEREAPETPFKKHLVNEFRHTFYKHYLERMEYAGRHPISVALDHPRVPSSAAVAAVESGAVSPASRAALDAKETKETTEKTETTEERKAERAGDFGVRRDMFGADRRLVPAGVTSGAAADGAAEKAHEKYEEEGGWVMVAGGVG